MRLYSGSSTDFIQDSVHNRIADKLKTAFFEYYRYNPGPAEVQSWRNSLRAVSQVFDYSGLKDQGVILEYQLPLTSKRLDCMICGTSPDQSRPNSVVIELKQWDRCEEAVGDLSVLTWTGGAKREVLHPSVQVGQYRMFLEDNHSAFYEDDDPIQLSACSYLHNYRYSDSDQLLAEKFKEPLLENPLFSETQVDDLAQYLRGRVSGGRGLEVMRRVEHSQYRPSKKLMEHVARVIKDKPQYILLDEQLVVYDRVLSMAKKGYAKFPKTVLIVKGGPGTGKSVIAINLLADLLRADFNAHYATGSKAFTETLRKIIGTKGSQQFKYFNSYASAKENEIDVLIADEAHRIRSTSNSRFTRKENKSDKAQIEELLRVSKVSVFFVDDAQVVRPNEIGSSGYVRQMAEKLGAEILEYELEAQFRCSGSDAYINWINNTLGFMGWQRKLRF